MKRIFIIQGGEGIDNKDLHMADLVLHRKSFGNQLFSVMKSPVHDTDGAITYTEAEIGTLISDVLRGHPVVKTGAVYQVNKLPEPFVCVQVGFSPDHYQMIGLFSSNNQFFPYGGATGEEIHDAGFTKVEESVAKWFLNNPPNR